MTVNLDSLPWHDHRRTADVRIGSQAAMPYYRQSVIDVAYPS